MSESAAYPKALDEKLGSVRFRYWPIAPRPTQPSGVSFPSSATALITALGRFFGARFFAASADFGLPLGADSSAVSAGCHSKKWSLALRSASGVFASPTMLTVAPRSRSFRQRYAKSESLVTKQYVSALASKSASIASSANARSEVFFPGAYWN